MRIWPLMLAVLALLLGCSGCGRDETTFTPFYGREICPEDQDRAAAYVRLVCQASSSERNEDPEDSIREATRSALEIFGRARLGIWVHQLGFGAVFVPYEQLPPEVRERLDLWTKGIAWK